MLAGVVVTTQLGIAGDGLLPRDLRGDEPGRVRGDHRARARDRAGRRHLVAVRPRRATGPLLAWPMTIAMLALAGFPATAGFFGKIYLINAAVDNGYAWLGVVIVLGSAVSLAYYLRVVAAVWMRSPSEAPATLLRGAAGDRRRLARGRRRGPRGRSRARRRVAGDPAGHRRGRRVGSTRRRAGRRRRLRQPEVVFVAVVCALVTVGVRRSTPSRCFDVARDAGEAFQSLRLIRPRGANFSGAAPLRGSCPIAPTAGQAIDRVHRRASPSWRRCSSSPRRRWAHPTSRGAVVAQAPARALHRRRTTSARRRRPRTPGSRRARWGRTTTGHEVSVTAFSIEVGHRLDADGHAAVGRHASRSSGPRAAARGVERRTPGGGCGRAGARSTPAGRSARAARVQAPRGWVFPDQATADRFLEHALVNSVDDGASSRRPGTRSRAAREVSGAMGDRGRRRRAQGARSTSSAIAASGRRRARRAGRRATAS